MVYPNLVINHKTPLDQMFLDYFSVLPYYIVLAVKAWTTDLLCPLTVSVLFRGHNNFDTPNMKESECLFMPYPS
jgi:hypothetical protein